MKDNSFKIYSTKYKRVREDALIKLKRVVHSKLTIRLCVNLGSHSTINRQTTNVSQNKCKFTVKVTSNFNC